MWAKNNKQINIKMNFLQDLRTENSRIEVA